MPAHLRFPLAWLLFALALPFAAAQQAATPEAASPTPAAPSVAPPASPQETAPAAAASSPAQEAGTTPAQVAGTAVAAGKETDAGHHGKGKKKKEKPPKMTHVEVANGTLTVDGWTGKAQLNYDIIDLKYMYFYAPGVGTAVVSNLPFPGGKEEKLAFDDKTLTFSVDGHAFQLTSDTRLLGKKPESAWVKLDPHYQADAKFPVMGYGLIATAPYAWPGAQRQQVKNAGLVAPPPLPPDFRPKLATAPCFATVTQPCVAPATVPAQSVAPATQPRSDAVKVTGPAAESAKPAADGQSAGTSSGPSPQN